MFDTAPEYADYELGYTCTKRRMKAKSELVSNDAFVRTYYLYRGYNYSVCGGREVRACVRACVRGRNCICSFLYAVVLGEVFVLHNCSMHDYNL